MQSIAILLDTAGGAQIPYTLYHI